MKSRSDYDGICYNESRRKIFMEVFLNAAVID